jgi:hypothetical protein
MCVRFFVDPIIFPLQIKQFIYIEILRRNNGIDEVQNRSIEIEVMCLNRFCCPIIVNIVVKNLLKG